MIDGYHYATSIVYPENAILRNGLGDNQTWNGYILDSDVTSENFTLDATPPSIIKFGFAASTGQYFSRQLIKTLQLRLPGSPETMPDYGEIISGNVLTPALDVLANDLGFTGPKVPGQVGSRQYLDDSSFQFEVSSGNNKFKTVTSPYKDDQGVWTYNGDGTIGFTAYPDFKGNAVIYYSIKNNKDNYHSGDDEYRSGPTEIIINVKREATPALSKVVVNKFLKSNFTNVAN